MGRIGRVSCGSDGGCIDRAIGRDPGARPLSGSRRRRGHDGARRFRRGGGQGRAAGRRPVARAGCRADVAARQALRRTGFGRSGRAGLPARAGGGCGRGRLDLPPRFRLALGRRLRLAPPHQRGPRLLLDHRLGAGRDLRRLPGLRGRGRGEIGADARLQRAAAARGAGLRRRAGWVARRLAGGGPRHSRGAARARALRARPDRRNQPAAGDDAVRPAPAHAPAAARTPARHVPRHVQHRRRHADAQLSPGDGGRRALDPARQPARAPLLRLPRRGRAHPAAGGGEVDGRPGRMERGGAGGDARPHPRADAGAERGGMDGGLPRIRQRRRRDIRRHRGRGRERGDGRERRCRLHS